jgi:hypothetical protein
MLRALFGERKAKSFEGLIGIRMWNRLCGTISTLEEKLSGFKKKIFWHVYVVEWIHEVQEVVDRSWIKSEARMKAAGGRCSAVVEK